MEAPGLPHGKRRDVMTRFTVRRLTAAVILMAVLCTAAPASAAPASRPASPAVLGLSLFDSLFDPFFAWLGSFRLGSENGGQAAAEKANAPSGSGDGSTDEGQLLKADHSGTLDPNG
jgi:hypothetical protein